MAVNKALPVAFFPVATRRNEYNYNFLPGKLRANLPAPKVKNPIILEADAVILEINPHNWLSFEESKPIHRVNTAYPDLSPEEPLQLPPFLRQTFMEAYRRQADLCSDLPSKGAWVNLTA
jgi:hypothetical protein